jgi:HD-GYP domain-containing protein (c-di-GMP phosphodiesterase class II)
MLKRIAVAQLRPGMHVARFDGAWLDHPFWRQSRRINNASDAEALTAGGVRAVWIDLTRGCDTPPTRAEVSAQAGSIDDVAPSFAAEGAATSEAQIITVAAATPAPTQQITIEAELERAARICHRAKAAVITMFGEARMGKAIDTHAAVALVDEISASVTRNPGALVNLARLKTADDYTYMHSVAVCGLMIALASELGLGEDATRQAGFAGLLHDLGKALVPLSILNKPGRLTADEFDHMRRHPQLGHRMLVEGDSMNEVALDVCLHHHERVDGAGYPHGLDDARISLYAKMGAVCDVYDAITSNRPYKAGWDPAESIGRMAEWSSGQFDQRVFQAFVKSVGIYPVGALVRMQSGRLAVVIDQNPAMLTRPRVKVFFSTRANAQIKPEIIDLSRANEPDRIASREDPARWQFRNLDEIWAGEHAPEQRLRPC